MGLFLVVAGMIGLAVIFPPIILLYIIGIGITISDFRK